MDDKEKIKILENELKRILRENDELKYRLEINNIDQYKERFDKLLKTHKTTLVKFDAMTKKYTELVKEYHCLVAEWKKDVGLQ